MPRIGVERLVVGDMGVNCYIVENQETKQCIIVDPGAQPERIIRAIGERKPAAVLLTHGHFDHIGAVDAVCGHYGIPLYMHREDAPKLTDADANVSGLFGLPLVQHTEPVMLEGGETLSLAGIDLEVLHTPGHSRGCVCYMLPEHQGILTGDTLFAHGYGRTDFVDGDFMALCRSLQHLLHLTPQRITYPGHDEPGIVGRNAVEGE